MNKDVYSWCIRKYLKNRGIKVQLTTSYRNPHRVIPHLKGFHKRNNCCCFEFTKSTFYKKTTSQSPPSKCKCLAAYYFAQGWQEHLHHPYWFILDFYLNEYVKLTKYQHLNCQIIRKIGVSKPNSSRALFQTSSWKKKNCEIVCDLVISVKYGGTSKLNSWSLLCTVYMVDSHTSKQLFHNLFNI